VECGSALLCRFGFSLLVFCFGQSTSQNRKNESGGAKHRRTPHQTANTLAAVVSKKFDLPCAAVRSRRSANGGSLNVGGLVAALPRLRQRIFPRARESGGDGGTAPAVAGPAGCNGSSR